MYIQIFEQRVAPGRIRDHEERVTTQFAMLKAQPGFIGGGLSRSIGQPTIYRRVHRWEDQASAWTYLASDSFASYLRANPMAGIVTPTRPMDAFELIHSTGTGGASYIQVAEFAISAFKGPEFEASRKELADLRQKLVPTVSGSLLFRYLGNRIRYQIVINGESAEAVQTANFHPAVTAYLQAHPITSFGGVPAAPETFVTIDRV